MKKYYLKFLTGAFAISATCAAAQPVDATGNDARTPATSDHGSPILSLDQLDSMRGGTQVAINNQSLIAENTGNTINGDFAAGDVNLEDNAFSSFNGLGNFVFNTGAQSSLQAGMSAACTEKQYQG